MIPRVARRSKQVTAPLGKRIEQAENGDGGDMGRKLTTARICKRGRRSLQTSHQPVYDTQALPDEAVWREQSHHN